MHARRFLLVFMAACAVASCRPGPEAFTLSVSVKPKPMRDDGTPGTVTVSAVDAAMASGKGSVRLQSSAGSLVDGVTLQLDENGQAQTDFSCSLALDPGCVGTVTLTASWLTAGYIITADVSVLLTVTDARASACAPMNLRQLAFTTAPVADVQLGLADTMPETRAIGLGTGEVGTAIYDAPNNVAAFAVNTPAQSADVLDEQTRIINLIGTTGAVSNPLSRTFSTWDRFPAVRTGFELAGTDTLKVRIDALSTKIAGLNSGLTASAVKGPFRAVMTVSVRSGKTAVALAVAPAAGFADPIARALDDIAGGSAFAAASDHAAASQCEVFTAAKQGNVDFVWVVDDSGSMGSSQNAVAAVGGQIVGRLVGSLVDFRAAGVSTGYYGPDFQGSSRDWTTETNVMLGWFSGANSWGTSGSGNEQGFSGLHSFIDGDSPPAALVPGPFRPDSDVHILFLTDAPEQSSYVALDMVDYLTARLAPRRVVVHGILCPESPPPPGKVSNCGDSDEAVKGKYHTVVRQTGGVLGSILTFNKTPVTTALGAQQSDTMKAIVQSVISGAGFALAHRPIVSSVRVATSATRGKCDNTDIPRDDDSGWQLDPTSGKLSFVGSCAPPIGATIAVSYQYWTH